MSLVLLGILVSMPVANAQSARSVPSAKSAHAAKSVVDLARDPRSRNGSVRPASGQSPIGTSAITHSAEDYQVYGPGEAINEGYAASDFEPCYDRCSAPGDGLLTHLLDWSRCDLFVGATAFSNAGNFLTAPANATGQIEGNSGFQEGFNFASCMPGLLGGQVGSQIGLRATQTQLEGTAAGEDARNQLFVTGGLFRRVDYGVQGGAVIDYLHDDGLTTADLVQVRAELGFMLSPCHEAGFRAASSLNTSNSTAQINGLAAPVAVQLTTLNTYRFYYRCALGEAGRAMSEFNAGFTEDKDALLGATLSAPLHGSVGMAGTATYLIPHNGLEPSYRREAWNMGLALVWTPGRPFGCGRDYYRPLFDVADNGNLISKAAGQ